MSFSTYLDKYLTTPPEDDFSTYFELVYEHYSEEFYNNIGSFENSMIEHEWIEKLYNKETDPKLAAQIIQRAHKINKL